MKLGFAVCVSLLLAPLAVNAAEAPPFTRVALLLPACELPGMSADELRDAVAVELLAAGLSLAPRGELSPATDVLVRIDAACPQGDQITLVAEFAEQRQRRRVELGELARAQHARALSLSLAELLATFSRTEPAATPIGGGTSEPPPATDENAPTPVPTQPAPAAKPAPSAAAKPRTAPRKASADQAPATSEARGSPAPHAWQPGLAPQLRAFEGTWLWGGRARLQHDPWIGSADLLAAHRSVTAGEVTTWLAQVSIGYQARLWGSTAGPLLEAGPRGGAGIVVLHAVPHGTARGADALDAYFDAAVTTRFSLELGRAVRSGVGAEVGYARGPLGHADGVEVSRTAGPFAALLLDLTLQ